MPYLWQRHPGINIFSQHRANFADLCRLWIYNALETVAMPPVYHAISLRIHRVSITCWYVETLELTDICTLVTKLCRLVGVIPLVDRMVRFFIQSACIFTQFLKSPEQNLTIRVALLILLAIKLEVIVTNKKRIPKRKTHYWFPKKSRLLNHSNNTWSWTDFEIYCVVYAIVSTRLWSILYDDLK